VKISEPQISFIVPIFNVEKYLEKCVESILSQTLQDIEIILVNDGSTDSSLSICTQIAATQPRVQVLSQENSGQGVARNHGLSVARGTFISFVDPDDWIHPDMVAHLLPVMKQSAADFVSFRIAYVTEQGATSYVLAPFKKSILINEEIFNHALIDDQIYTSSCNKLYLRSFLIKNDINFPALRAYEDTYYTRIMASHATKCVFVDEVLYYALVRAGSTSRNLSTRNFDLAVQVIELEQAALQITSRSAYQRDLFDAHVVKFFSYLIILAAFRLDSWRSFVESIKMTDQIGFRSKRADGRVLRHLNLRNKIMAGISFLPRLLWSTARVLRNTRFTPY
jgi:glycosyltransferase EpsH